MLRGTIKMKMTRDSAAEARAAHNREAAGSIPAPATWRATHANSPFVVWAAMGLPTPGEGGG